MKKEDIMKMKKKEYEGMKMVPIKGIGIRNNTKTYINGSPSVKRIKSSFYRY